MGAAAVWCSHPAAFSLARAEIVFRVSTRTERRRIIRLAFVLAMGAASFLLLYFVSLRQLAKDSAQFDFWGQLFPPTGIRSHGRMPFRCVRRVRPRRDSPGFREWPFRGRGCGTVSDQPWARLDGLRVMHRYASSYVCPSISLGGRLLPFAAPIITFVVAEGVGGVHSQGKLVHVVVARIVLFLPLLNAIRGGLRSVSGIQRDDIRPLIEYLNAHAYLYDLGEAKR